MLDDRRADISRIIAELGAMAQAELRIPPLDASTTEFLELHASGHIVDFERLVRRSMVLAHARTIRGAALILGISAPTLHAWIERRPELHSLFAFLRRYA